MLKKLLLGLCLAVFVAFNVHASWPAEDEVESEDDSVTIDGAWNKVDQSQAWGKWLYGTKSYWDSINKIDKELSAAMYTKLTDGLTIEQTSVIEREGLLNFLNGLRAINPPAELKAYHVQSVELGTLATSKPLKQLENDMDLYNKMTVMAKAADDEYVRVLNEQGVPENVIKMFRTLYVEPVLGN